MAQTTLLAAGTTSATSSDFTVAAGDVATVGLFAATTARLPIDCIFNVMQDTPGADNHVVALDDTTRSVVVVGPGTFRVTRPAYTGTAFGVFLEA